MPQWCSGTRHAAGCKFVQMVPEHEEKLNFEKTQNKP